MPQTSRENNKAKLAATVFKNNRRLIDAPKLYALLLDILDSYHNSVDDGLAESQVNSDWDATSGVAQILNKPSTFPPESHTHAMSAITGLIAALAEKGELGGVSEEGDTLKKLYDLIVSSVSRVYVDDIAERDAYNVTKLPTSFFVADDGDGNWALYEATTTGVGATFIKISDPDLLNAVMTEAQIKIAYESNADTNAFTNAYKAMLNAVPTNRIKGRLTAGTGDLEDLTGTQVTTLLDVFTSSLKGLAPASGGGTVNFLRADGTWENPLPVVTEVEASTATTTTSTSDVLLNTMTCTPGEGTFLFLFTGHYYMNISAGTVTASLYVDGTLVASSVRPHNNDGAVGAVILQGQCALQKKVTVTAGQVVEIRWKVSAGTGTFVERILSWLTCQ